MRKLVAYRDADMNNQISFWDLPIGALFLFDDGLKTRRPYEKIGECLFSRPSGKHKWTMFRPNTLSSGTVMVPVQMVTRVFLKKKPGGGTYWSV